MPIINKAFSNKGIKLYSSRKKKKEVIEDNKNNNLLKDLELLEKEIELDYYSI